MITHQPEWHRLSTKKERRQLNAEVRVLALANVLRGTLAFSETAPTVQDVRRALGMKSKSALYSSCWRELIKKARKEGKIR